MDAKTQAEAEMQKIVNQVWIQGGVWRPPPQLYLSPKAWLAVDFSFIKIVDCDGWTADEWQEQLPITREEFLRRLARCTVSPNRPIEAVVVGNADDHQAMADLLDHLNETGDRE